MRLLFFIIGIKIRFYSGTVPKIDQQPIMTDNEFDKYKKTVQNEFKDNKFSLTFPELVPSLFLKKIMKVEENVELKDRPGQEI